LVHELRFQREGLRLAFSEGNTGLDNPSYVYEWVVTGDGGIWVITDHSGTRRNDVTPISFFKVAVGFRAIYDSEYSRNLTDWIYSLFSKYNEPNCGSFDCGFMEGADTSGRVVGVIIDRTNSLVLSAARYTIKGLLESYAVVRDISGGVWYRELNGGRGPWISLGGITPRAPSAAFYNGKLYVTINDVTDGIWVGSIDPSSRVFSGWRPLPGLTPSKPTLVSSDHGLILVVRDVSNGIWIYKNSTGEWISLPGLTIDSPAASAVRDILHIVVRGVDGSSLWHGTLNLTNNIFSGWRSLQGLSDATPDLTNNGTHIILMVKATGGDIWMNTYSRGWLGWRPVPGGLTDMGPAAIARYGKLMVMVKDVNSGIWVNVYEGGTWRGWTPIDGLTSSQPELVCIVY
jgi:hypothetical protein